MKPGQEAFALFGFAAVLAYLVYRKSNAPASPSQQVMGAHAMSAGRSRGGFHGVRRGGGVVYVAPSLPTVWEYADAPDLGSSSTQALIDELRRRRVIS